MRNFTDRENPVNSAYVTLESAACEAVERISRIAVAAVERAMLVEDGPYTVAGRYIPCPTQAARARRIEAERRVAAAERRAAWLAQHPCVWCGAQIAADEGFELMADEPMHRGACVDEFCALLDEARGQAA